MQWSFNITKLNARFFLNKLPDGKDYIITSRGLIRRKDVTNDGVIGGGEGSAEAVITDGGGVAPSTEPALAGTGDNRGNQNKNIPKTPESRRSETDQSAVAAPAPSTHKVSLVPPPLGVVGVAR